MSDWEHDEIVYEEGWRDAAPLRDMEPALPVEKEPQPEERVKSFPLLLSIQLGLSVLAVVILLILRAADSKSYRRFIDYYHDELKKPVVSQQVFEALDISKLFSDDGVSLKASPDETEAQRR